VLFDLLEESKKIVAIDTAASVGTRKLVEHLAPFCRALGFRVFLQNSPQNSNDGRDVDCNLIAHTQGEEASDLCPRGLAMVTHLDTVPAGDLSLWTETDGDPYRAAIKGDKLYGLGSADTKLDFLCKLLAIERVGLKKIKIPLALIGTFGEERSLAGARLIRESGIMKHKFALVGEPSELKAVVAHKGILYLRAKLEGAGQGEISGPATQKAFTGKAAHGSMPHLGDNAVEKALRWIVMQEDIEVLEIQGGTVHNVVPESCRIRYGKIQGRSGRVEFFRRFLSLMDAARGTLAAQSNADFDPPGTTDNIGVIRTAPTGEFEIEFDFRLIPETDGDALFQIFQPLKDLPGASVEIIRSNAPLNTPKDSEIARRVGKALTQIGLKPAYLVKSGNTEGAIFSAMGVEAVVIGPGRAVGNIHAPNEHNEISQLHKAVDFYEAFLRQFC
jgi:acetylornithine deacetylase/succinyl-diaminopimelate desuccinylase-like protein